jgi:hypothetical protein
MINQLITALSKEVGLSAEEIADTIWLALQIGEAESVSSDFPLSQEDKAGINNRDSQSNQETLSKSQPKTSDSQETNRNQTPDEQKAGIYPRTQHQTSTGSDLSFKVPDAPSLREPLTLARALKPLMRRLPSGTTLVLDEAATIQRIADEGLWLPVLRPTLEPWLDLELVVDESISMQIWRHTIRDLERLLKNYGIFRDVRVWGLITDEQEQVQIRRGIGATAKNQRPRSPAELIDPSGRRLVLVVSDCVSSNWCNGKVMSALEIWSKRGVMAIVQMLPKWLWKRTALGRASEVRLQGLIPGVFNQKLIAKEVSLWDELEEDRGIKVPVFTLEPDKVANWAQMLAGRGSIWTLGYVFKLDATSVNKESSLFNLDYAQMSAEQRVQAFRVTASPMARKLAGLLAAAPVITLPIVRLIRETLLKNSQQVHVAEVFLGGLLKPLFEINAETNPDYVQYDFIEGVRELLVDSVPSEYVLNVVDEVSKYVARRTGLSLEDFAAVLKSPRQGANNETPNEFVAFATVTTQVLRRLGGDYLKVADELEKNNRQDFQTNIQKPIKLDLGAFFRASNPADTMMSNADELNKYYIDFFPVRGIDIVRDIVRSITISPNQPTCNLFTGQVGCAKTTELQRLQAELEKQGFHAIYLASSKFLDMADVEVTDILLNIALQVTESLQAMGINIKPAYFANLATQIGDLNVIIRQARDSREYRSQLRQYLEPRTNNIIDAINQEVLKPAQEGLKQQGKQGLVIIVDNLDRVMNSIKPNGQIQTEYLFIERGVQLNQLHCHVVHTVPFLLAFPNALDRLANRSGRDPKVLPMVPIELRQGRGECKEGMALLKQMVMARAFPGENIVKRHDLITEIFDTPETLERLCRVSGGHPRFLLLILYSCLQTGDPPLTQAGLETVIKQRQHQLCLAMEDEDWALLRQVAKRQSIRSEEEYQKLVTSLWVYQYRDNEGIWFDVNPLLKESKSFL